MKIKSIALYLIGFTILSCSEESEDPVFDTVICEFEASEVIIDQTENVNFKDMSTGDPTSWTWLFEGGSPQTSLEQNPDVAFNDFGRFNVSLNASNKEYEDILLRENYITVLPTEGILAYYPLDGNAQDHSGNGYNGIINNQVIPSPNHNEVAEMAMSFDGIDASIDTETNEIGSELENGLTFSAWINSAETHTGRIVANYNGTGIPGNCLERIGFVFGINDNQQLVIFYATDGNDYIGRRTGLGEIQENTWYHVAGTWNGGFTNSSFRLYINGIQKDVVNQESGNVSCGYLDSQNTFHIGIGFCSAGACAPFHGIIDEVRIYNRALSEREIELLMYR